MNFGKISLLLFIGLFCAQFAVAQELTTNELGEKIIVYPDGSWKYAEASDIEMANEKETAIITPVKYADNDWEIAVQIAGLAASEETEAIRMEENAKYERMLIEDELQDAEASEEYTKDEVDEIKDRLKQAKKLEKKAKSFRKEATKKARKTSELVTMTPEKRAEELKKYKLNHTINSPKEIVSEEPFGLFPGEIIQEESQENPLDNAGEYTTPYSQDEKVFAKYDPSKNVLLNPPKADCVLAFNGVDEFSGKKRKDVDKQLFFTHTNEELRSIFKDQDYMTCTGYLSSLSGGLKFLTLNITIASKSAQREYGILEKGALINIKLLDGENVKLVNSKTNMGLEDPLEGTVAYRGQYIISSGDEKKLKRSEVDKVRIIWSSGYEDYEIYELDFFKHQFKCLEGK